MVMMGRFVSHDGCGLHCGRNGEIDGVDVVTKGAAWNESRDGEWAKIHCTWTQRGLNLDEDACAKHLMVHNSKDESCKTAKSTASCSAPTKCRLGRYGGTNSMVGADVVAPRLQCYGRE